MFWSIEGCNVVKEGKILHECASADEAREYLNRLNSSFDKVVAKRFSTGERKKDASSGVAEKDGSFPISNAKDLHDAIDDFGRAGSKPSDKAHIKSRAAALGLTNLLPKGW